MVLIKLVSQVLEYPKAPYTAGKCIDIPNTHYPYSIHYLQHKSKKKLNLIVKKCFELLS